jgi:hypothetical protein
MELGDSLTHLKESTTCPYTNQINPYLYPSRFSQAQFVSFLVGLRTYQHPWQWQVKPYRVRHVWEDNTKNLLKKCNGRFSTIF